MFCFNPISRSEENVSAMASQAQMTEDSAKKTAAQNGERACPSMQRGPDRRVRPTSAWRGLFGPNRRKGGRRAGETRNTFVDRFTAWDVGLLLLILVLNLLDAFFTLRWIQQGGAEANPFMAYMLELGDGFFLAEKCFVVGIWLIILTVHKNFRLAQIGLYGLAVVYSLLLAGHIALIPHGPDPAQPVSIQLGALEHPAEQGRDRGLHP